MLDENSQAKRQEQALTANQCLGGNGSALTRADDEDDEP
jgi:hypothetical protein